MLLTRYGIMNLIERIEQTEQMFFDQRVKKQMQYVELRNNEFVCMVCTEFDEVKSVTKLKQKGKTTFHYCERCDSYFCLIHKKKSKIDGVYYYCLECRKIKNEKVKPKHQCCCSENCTEMVPITNMYGRLQLYAKGHTRKGRRSQAEGQNIPCYQCKSKTATIMSSIGARPNEQAFYCKQCYRIMRRLKAKARRNLRK